jgi:hypothetical protein
MMSEYEQSAYSLPTQPQTGWNVHQTPSAAISEMEPEKVKSIRTDALFVLFVTFLLTICRYELVKELISR